MSRFPIAATAASLALLAAAFLSLTGCGNAGNEPGETPLRVGCDARYPPFESQRSDGEFEGFDIDLVEALGAHLGRPVEIVSMDFDALIPELKSGRLDLVCSGVSYTDERAEVVDFSDPYVQVPMGVLLSKERAEAVQGLDDLDREGVIVVVQRGTSGQQKALAAFPKAQIKTFDLEVDAKNDLVAGRAHALIYDMISIVRHNEQHPDETRILDADLGIEHYCVVFQKGDPLRDGVNAFLASATAPGGALDASFTRWLTQPERFRVKTD
jgi:polar amino acid transport system substrate-binding protein